MNTLILVLYNDTSLRFPEFYTDFSRLNSMVLSYQHFTLDLDVIRKSILKKYYPSGKIEDHSHLNTVEVIKLKIILIYILNQYH